MGSHTPPGTAPGLPATLPLAATHHVHQSVADAAPAALVLGASSGSEAAWALLHLSLGVWQGAPALRRASVSTVPGGWPPTSSWCPSEDMEHCSWHVASTQGLAQVCTIPPQKFSHMGGGRKQLSPPCQAPAKGGDVDGRTSPGARPLKSIGPHLRSPHVEREAAQSWGSAFVCNTSVGVGPPGFREARGPETLLSVTYMPCALHLTQ